MRPSLLSLIILITLELFVINTQNSFGASIWSDPLRGFSKLPAKRTENCQVNSGAETIDLIGAIDIALCNNTDTQIAWFNAKSNADLLGKSRSEYLPTITGAASEQSINTINNNSNSFADKHYGAFSPSISLNYLLFDFGGREARIELAKQQMLAAGYNYNSTMQTVIFLVVKNYANVLIAEELLNSAHQSEKASKEIYEAAKVKLRVGTATPADVAQAETSYSQSKLDSQNAENNLQIARGNFATTLRIAPNKKITLKEINFSGLTKPLDQNVEELINQAVSKRPDLAAAKANEEQAKAGLDQSNRSNYPSISAIGSASKTIYSDSNIRSREDNSFGIQLSVPFFTGFRNYYQIQSARNIYDAARTQRIKSENNAALDIWTTYNNYQTARTSYSTAESLLKSALMSEELTIGRYKVGKGNLLDALNSQAKSAEARFIQVQSKNNLLITKFDLDRSLGLINNIPAQEFSESDNSFTFVD